MKKFLRSILSQEIINDFYHRPIAYLANIYYGFPARGLKVIGVTGTDGKTTTVNMIYQILRKSGKKVSMISTINAVIGGKNYDTGFHVTSPSPFMVQKFLKQAIENGDEYIVLEATSHALDQHRFAGVNFDIGVITNITHEHLDYHKTFDNYVKTKLKLIENAKFAVVNSNLKGYITQMANSRVTFGIEKGDFNQPDIKLKLKIPGDYNIGNALAAMSVAYILGIDRNTSQKALENFTGLTGRMEEVKNSRGIKIIIDFAHTPNALENVLTTLRTKETSGRLIALIGCEGLRDIGKREMMGQIAQRLSDVVIVTAVDPRGQIREINRRITQGARKEGAKDGINFFVIEDRGQAINFAINKLARRGDVVGIFGKGHEQSMNLDGKKEILWSDREMVEKWIVSTN